jgi:hypothetical protein
MLAAVGAPMILPILVKLVLLPAPPQDLHVTLDGDPVARLDQIDVPPGPHVFEVSAPEFDRVRQAFVVGNDEVTVAVTLHENPIVDMGVSRRRTAKYMAVGGAGVWGLGIGLSLFWRSRWEQLVTTESGVAMCKVPTASCAQQANSYLDKIRYWGTGLSIAGAATLVAAGIVYWTAPGLGRVEHTIVAPAVGPGQAGIVISRGF